MERERTIPLTEAEEQFVVAIGASAGGLEAIHEFFDHMPPDSNCSFVIIQHLSPDYKSLLVELVSKHTKMRVLEAQHNGVLEPNCVYVIPNNKILQLRGMRLQLTEKHFDNSINTAIDIFLKSLAEDRGARAIAVILSGTGTDGTRGIEAIQQAGGMIIVQEPGSAKFDGMPNSAIAAGYADFVLSPAQMPDEIVSYSKEKTDRRQYADRPDENSLPEVLRLIEKSCGYDFHNYKSPTIIRRIIRRMNHLGKKKFADYLEQLRGDSEECKSLGKEFLIGVTKFFRDRAAFEIFANEVLPEMIRSKIDGDVLKVWVTACSTGQEAYSLAILISEHLRRIEKSIEVKIFATDIDIDAIEFASRGSYPASLLADVEDEIVARYFQKQGSHYIVSSALRKQIVFARHNILKDPPFIKNDLVTCRNMLIYMNSILQRRVFSTLQYALNNGGVLFLGPSEIPSSISSTLQEINGKWRIYRKIGNEKHQQHVYEPAQSIRASRTGQVVKENTTARELAEDFRNVLTDEYRYAAIYVDRNYEIKEALGDFRHYLSLPQKIVNLNLLKMVGQDLAVALNSGLRKALKENVKVALQVRPRAGSEERPVQLIIKPPKQPDGLILVVLGEGHEQVQFRGQTELTAQPDSDTAAYIAEIEEELKETRVNLQMAVESLETTNEELQSSNEELLSANEELQSSNEELQSLNEELHTLNTEHQLRIKELLELNDDLNNYFRSTDIGQVFVDRNGRIRKFNPAAVQLINLIESDIGRPIDHISTNVRDENLMEDVRRVLTQQVQIEKEVSTFAGRSVLMRILPYIRLDHVVDGVVITFFDITTTRELNHIIKGVFNASLSAVFALRSVRDLEDRIVDFTVNAANHAADELLGLRNFEYVNESLRAHFPKVMNVGLFDQMIVVVEEEKQLHKELMLTDNNVETWYEVVGIKMLDGLVLTLTDITEKKLAEEKLRRSYQELMRTKENLKTLNASLEEKVLQRTAELSASEERFRLIAANTNDMVWDWNLALNEMWWSESFLRLVGLPEDAPVLTPKEWLAHVHPDDRARVESSIHQAVNGGESWTARFRLCKADGSEAIISGKGVLVVDEYGVPYRMVGALVDISYAERTEGLLQEQNQELQRLYDEFRFVTDFMPQMVWSSRADGFHDFFNKQMYDYTGLGYDQLKGEDGWGSVVHPEDQARARQAWLQSLATGSVYEVEYRFRRHDGVYRWFLGRALPLRNERDEVVKWFGTCTDIHDAKLQADVLEQKVRERTAELTRSNSELEASNSELLQFASVASHDLKEPLRKIHIFSNIIRDRYLDMAQDGARDYIDRIINSSARMTKLINDLLAYSRLSVNHFFEHVDLNAVLQEVLSDLELFIEERHARVEADQLPELEAVPGQLRQVLQNIISNALKFTRPGVAPLIQIRCTYQDRLALDAPAVSEGPYCRISITDNGIGFDDQYAAKIFTIFQRLHSREKYDGTGIGLAITKKILDRHNGLVTAHSKENEGSTFILILPLKQERREQTGGGDG
ncbi:PAS domain S-box protein [Flaviaesturariibacter flavus]|uniref:PAS domain S-box protein n=1 Tax=Flaviaesturariibacter flavus TaxID=2502780 RepID=A0A4R1B1Z5_9BACT|nr:chemotaxis protein CheB [Flaviaesturariibacter flavus]TCJ12054.1 PAS domain S-box protein [Flaviaesturariibacter flavus]